MTRTDWILIGLAVLLLADIAAAELRHRRLIETLDLGFSMVLDWLKAIKDRADGAK